MKRVIIVHGWGGTPESDWFPWLKEELNDRGYRVIVPLMPETDEPKIEPWIKKLREAVGEPDAETIFIGHSIGCQTILRYLQTAAGNAKETFFVAGWFNLILDNIEEKEIAAPWFATPINLEAAKEKAGKITAIFSDDDPYVPHSDWEKFKTLLGAEVIILKKRGHICEDDGAAELPEILKIIDNIV